MSKKKWVCMALALVALVCGMTLVGCEEGTPLVGTIRVHNNSTVDDYWVGTPTIESADVRELEPDDYYDFFLQEGSHYLYYRKSEGETFHQIPENAFWYSKGPYNITKNVTIDVNIP